MRGLLANPTGAPAVIMMIRTHRAHLGSHRLHQADWDSASTRMISLSAIHLLLLPLLMMMEVMMMMEKRVRHQAVDGDVEELAD